MPSSSSENKYKGKFRDEMSPVDYADYYRQYAAEKDLKVLNGKQKKEAISKITYSDNHKQVDPLFNELILAPKTTIASMTDSKETSVLSDGKGCDLGTLAEYGLPDLVPYEFENLLPFSFRKSQGKAFKLIMQKALKKIKKIVVSLPPASGKTLLAIFITIMYLKKHPDKMVFFCVHIDSLVIQSFLEFVKWTGEKVGVIQATNELHLSRPIQIVSLDSIKNRLGDGKKVTPMNGIFRQLDVGLIFIDECHRSTKGAEYLIDHYHDSVNSYDDKSMVIGLSGTPYAAFLYNLYGGLSLVRPYSMIEIMAHGDIVNYKMIEVSKKLDTSKLVENKNGEFADDSHNEAIDSLVVGGHPANDWWENEETKNKYTMVFAPSIKGAVSLYTHFTEWALSTGNIDPDSIAITHSQMKKDHISKAMLGCKTGRVLIIISVQQLTVGFDAAHFEVGMIFKFLAASKTRYREPNSPIAMIQRATRLMRSFAGGAVCLSVSGKHSIRKGSFSVGDAVEVEGEFLQVIKVLPPKRMAMILDYTNLSDFDPPYIIEARYDKLQKTRSKKELEEDRQELLEDIEGKLEEPEKLLPKVICGNCAAVIEKPPFCGGCGMRMKDTRSTVIEGLELVLEDGQTRIVHVADNIKEIFAKIKADRERQEEVDSRNIRVNYKKLTIGNKVGIMAAVKYMMHIDGTKGGNNELKVQSAKYHSVVDRGENWDEYKEVNKKSNKIFNTIMQEKKMGSSDTLKGVSKFISKINGLNPRYKKHHSLYK